MQHELVPFQAKCVFNEQHYLSLCTVAFFIGAALKCITTPSGHCVRHTYSHCSLQNQYTSSSPYYGPNETRRAGLKSLLLSSENHL